VSGSDSPVIDPEVFGGTGFCYGDSSWITVLVLVIRMLIPDSSSVVSGGSGNPVVLGFWFRYVPVVIILVW